MNREFDDLTLFENNDIIVYVDGKFDHWLKYYRIEQAQISQMTLGALIPLVYAQLTSMGVNTKVKDKSYCSKAIILVYGVGIGLIKPFDVFDDIVEQISLSTNLLENRETIYEFVDYYNKDFFEEGQGIYIKIFDRPVERVRGWLAYVSPEEISILFFGYKDPPEEDLLKLV